LAALLISSTALVAWRFASREGRGEERSNAAPRANGTDITVRRTGVSSCAAFACHGGNGSLGDSRSAYSTWMARDPHSRAFSVLSEPISAEIEGRLAARSAGAPISAESDARCLGCHADPGLSRSGQSAGAILSEGVGCESCHGAASEWLADHSLPEWKPLAVDRKRRRGMQILSNPAERARTCVECHVGGAGGDVDHDLIAAGHPRLTFELTADLAAIPKHWTVAPRRGANGDAEIRDWLLGQIVTARASIALLENRARDAASRPWPELAEYDCFSCHHDLTEPAWSSRRRSAPESLGVLRWGSCYMPVMNGFAAGRTGAAAPRASTTFGELRRLMVSARPDSGQIEHLAHELQNQLDAWLNEELAGRRFDAEQLGRVLSRCLADRSIEGTPSWEYRTQMLGALGLLERALEREGRQLNATFADKLNAMRLREAIPDGFDGPHGSAAVESTEWTESVRALLESAGFRGETGNAPPSKPVPVRP
jgi:hypothetical protein